MGQVVVACSSFHYAAVVASCSGSWDKLMAVRMMEKMMELIWPLINVDVLEPYLLR